MKLSQQTCHFWQPKYVGRVREHMGLSRPPFANMLGIPMTTLKNYELGYRDSSADLLLIFANHPQLKPFIHYMLDQSTSAELLNERIVS